MYCQKDSKFKKAISLYLVFIIITFTLILPVGFVEHAKASGTHYYVDNDGGNDAWAGTSSAPKQTLGAGFGLLSAGDILHIDAGTYDCSGGIDEDDLINGTAGAFTTLTDNGTGEVILAGEGAWSTVFLHSSAYVEISNVTICNNGSYYGLQVHDASHNISIQNCKFNNTFHSGCYFYRDSADFIYDVWIENCTVVNTCGYPQGRDTPESYQEGISLSGVNRFLVAYNYVGQCGKECYDFKSGSCNGTVMHNRANTTNGNEPDESKLGFYVDGFSDHCSNITLHSNVAWGNGTGFCLGAEAGGYCDNITFYNNIANLSVYGAEDDYGFTIPNYAVGQPYDNCSVINNVFFTQNHHAMKIDEDNASFKNLVVRNNILAVQNYWYVFQAGSMTPDDPEVTFDNNTFWQYGSDERTKWEGLDNQGVFCDDNITEDPGFVDWENGKFWLNATSPCIDNGSSVDAPSIDFNGTARPQIGDYDMGAFERVPPGDAPSPPTGFSATYNTEDTISLGWTKGTNATNTYIYRNATGEGYPTRFNGTLVYSSTGTSFSDTGLSDDTTYYYSAYSYNTSTLLYSTAVTETETTYEGADDPTNLVVARYNHAQLNLSWTKGDSEQSTVIVRKQGSYPADKTDGTEIYNGTLSTYKDTGLTPAKEYFYRAWGWNGLNTSSGYAEDFNYTLPQPPQNLQGIVEGSNINVSWDKGTGANNTIICRNETQLPDDPTNSTEDTKIYNGTGTYVVEALAELSYYAGWSWAVINGTAVYSLVQQMLWGGIEINVYKQTNASIEIENYTVLISTQTGDDSYSNTSANNPCILTVDEVPNGEKIAIQISKDGYEPQIQYWDLYDNFVYNLSFYLPPDVEGGGNTSNADYIPPSDYEEVLRTTVIDVALHTADQDVTLECSPDEMYSVAVFNQSVFYYQDVSEDYYSLNDNVLNITSDAFDENSTLIRAMYYCPNTEDYAQYYTVIVSEPKSEYGALQEVDNALVSYKRYIPETGEWEVMEKLYTDASGSVGVNLIPGTLYKFNISKTGYTTISGDDWSPGEGEVSHLFIINKGGEIGDYCTFDSFVNYSFAYSDTGIWFSFNDTFEVIDYAKFVLHYLANGTNITVAYDYTELNVYNYSFECDTDVDYILYVTANVSDYEDCNGKKMYNAIYIHDYNYSVYNQSDLDTILESILGDSPLYRSDSGPGQNAYVPWTYLIMFVVALFVATSFGKRNGFLGMMGAGFVLILFSVVLIGVSVLWLHVAWYGNVVTTVIGSILVAIGLVGTIGGVEDR